MVSSSITYRLANLSIFDPQYLRRWHVGVSIAVHAFRSYALSIKAFDLSNRCL